MSAPVWHLFSGELARGGIGDYTRLLADALADADREVHVWAPDAAGAALRRAVAHPLPGVGSAALRRMDAALDRDPRPRRLLVQYAPQAWGMKGMNVPFCRWLLARRSKGDDVRVMFHEPFFPFGWQRPQRNLLAAANRWMARLLLRASTRGYVSTGAWEPLLRPLAPPGLAFTPLPIPSTIPFTAGPDRVAELRRRLSQDGRRPVFVHFGTYGGMIAPLLSAALNALVQRCPDARILLLGHGGPAYAARLAAADARFADAVAAPGGMDPGDVSLHLQASDVAIQPYPDGADTRRTSLMACLANGVPTAATGGRFTDAVWDGSPLRTVACDRPATLADAALELLQAPDRRRIGRQTQAFYRARFAVEHTVARLLVDEGGG